MIRLTPTSSVSGKNLVRSVIMVGVLIIGSVTFVTGLLGIYLSTLEESRSDSLLLEQIVNRYYSYFLGDLLNGNPNVILNRVKLLDTRERDTGVVACVYSAASKSWYSSAGIESEEPKLEGKNVNKEIVSDDKVIGSLKVFLIKPKEIWKAVTAVYFIFVISVLVVLGLVFYFGVRKINSVYFKPLYELQLATARLNTYLLDESNQENPLNKLPESRLTEINSLKTTIQYFFDTMKTGIENEKILTGQLNRKHYMETIAKQVAHDMSSPIAALKYLRKDLAKMESFDVSLFDSIVQRVKEISDNLINQSKHESTRKNLGREIILLVKEKQIELNGKYGESVFLVDVKVMPSANYEDIINFDWARFKRCLSNLINNSCEAMTRVGRRVGRVNVLVELHSSSNLMQLCMSVADNGPGFSDEQLIEFKNQNGIIKSFHNSGVGLSSCVEWVKSQGGTIDIKSASTGAKVEIFVPIAIAVTV